MKSIKLFIKHAVYIPSVGVQILGFENYLNILSESLEGV